MNTPWHENDRAKGGIVVKPRKKKMTKSPKRVPAKKQPSQLLPPWNVILHNDKVNYVTYVEKTLVEICHLSEAEAKVKTRVAHRTGQSLVKMTHKEHAELVQDQLTSKRLTVTIEPGA